MNKHMSFSWQYDIFFLKCINTADKFRIPLKNLNVTCYKWNWTPPVMKRIAELPNRKKIFLDSKIECIGRFNAGKLNVI